MAVIRNKRIDQHAQRKARVRAKLKGSNRPRLSVFRSNRFITVQIIDDATATTLAQATSQKTEARGVEAARAVGKEIAEKAKAKGINDIVFDRGGYAFEGNIKALADAVREQGLNF